MQPSPHRGPDSHSSPTSGDSTGICLALAAASTHLSATAQTSSFVWPRSCIRSTADKLGPRRTLSAQFGDMTIERFHMVLIDLIHHVASSSEAQILRVCITTSKYASPSMPLLGHDRPCCAALWHRVRTIRGHGRRRRRVMIRNSVAKMTAPRETIDAI